MPLSIQHRLLAEIPELRGDPQVHGLLGAGVKGNVDTIFDVLQYDIPIERVVPPTAVPEYARRLAQRGVPVRALVRAPTAWVGKTLLDTVLAETRDAGLVTSDGVTRRIPS